MADPYASWGLYPKLPQRAVALSWRDQAFPAVAGEVLPRGNGRSYGDSCLTDNGTLIDACGLDRLIAFDPASGRLTCEAGVLLRDILAFAVPRGWFVPVAPGTQLVTVGGAIANDVHGKNHHRRGAFGHHLLSFELLRSDGRRIRCTPDGETELFQATIGGLGLTGLIVSAELQLMPVKGAFFDVETIRFDDLGSFFALSADSDGTHEYTVAWIDCLARGGALGRGIFTRANHASSGGCRAPGAPRRIPLTPPISPINGLTLRAFNELYYRLPRPRRSLQHFQSFLYPLDSLLDWNRLYGPRGFLQHQCVVPPASAPHAMRAILGAIAEAGTGSMLAVLKVFGSAPGRGLVSFARPGTTLALDFPFGGASTLALLDRLDRIVMEAGGAVYPAKDARMSSEAFRRGFPDWQKLEAMRDPKVMSAFWRRVTADTRKDS
ncbi:MAG: FAD-binding oxidoreductase [Alphaproteobacteria bacterium]|nr:FAD-binding oxidoreductase [Alphaproteobacteria bacterium]